MNRLSLSHLSLSPSLPLFILTSLLGHLENFCSDLIFVSSYYSGEDTWSRRQTNGQSGSPLLLHSSRGSGSASRHTTFAGGGPRCLPWEEGHPHCRGRGDSSRHLVSWQASLQCLNTSISFHGRAGRGRRRKEGQGAFGWEEGRQARKVGRQAWLASLSLMFPADCTLHTTSLCTWATHCLSHPLSSEGRPGRWRQEKVLGRHTRLTHFGKTSGAVGSRWYPGGGGHGLGRQAFSGGGQW